MRGFFFIYVTETHLLHKKPILNLNISFLVSGILNHFMQNKTMFYFCQKYRQQNWMCERFHEENPQIQFCLDNFVFWNCLFGDVNTIAGTASGVCVGRNSLTFLTLFTICVIKTRSRNSHYLTAFSKVKCFGVYSGFKMLMLGTISLELYNFDSENVCPFFLLFTFTYLDKEVPHCWP